MKLLSRKLARHSSAGRDESKEGADIISTLPDALLTQILSFLPLADVKQTRILSNRWKDLWAFLPNLLLVMPSGDASKFHDFVDQTLALRDGMPIEGFTLYCLEACNCDVIYDWLGRVVKNKVQKIELGFPPDGFSFKFCWNLFRTCDTLVELTLGGQFVLDVAGETELLFPRLKKINLVSILYLGAESLTNLISGCPVLEELIVDRQTTIYPYNPKMFKVASHSLKRLTMLFTGDSEVVIDAPNLEYMCIEEFRSQKFTFLKLFSLVEAHITIPESSNTEFLLTGLSSVKILTIPCPTVNALAAYSHIPVFTNLVKLAIGLDYTFGWHLLSNLLESMPHLEYITFLDGLVPLSMVRNVFYMGWDPPTDVPHCLQFTMKEITIRNREDITREEFPLIKYLLKHSYHLEILSFNNLAINPNTREQLLKFPRGSTLCRIEFL